MNAGAQPFVPGEAKPNDASGSPGGEGADGKAGSNLWRPQYRGKIRSFNEQKGFGFIDCDETLAQFGRDVFIHRYQMMESGLYVNQEVMFEVETNKTGQPQARRVRAATLESASGPFFYGVGQEGQGPVMPFQQPQQFGGNSGMASFSGGRPPQRQQNKAPRAAEDDHEVEESLQSCATSKDIDQIIASRGHEFNKRNVVTALYQLGLFRQYENQPNEPSLTVALLDRILVAQVDSFDAEQASRVIWALAQLDEMKNNANAHRLAMELAHHAVKSHRDYTPVQMTKFVQSLSRLVRSQEEDELVGKLTTLFSEFAMGQGDGSSLPRFPQEDLRIWEGFLREASGAQPQQPQAFAQPQMQRQQMPQQMMGGFGMSQLSAQDMQALAVKGMQWPMGAPGKGMMAPDMGMGKGGARAPTLQWGAGNPMMNMAPFGGKPMDFGGCCGQQPRPQESNLGNMAGFGKGGKGGKPMYGQLDGYDSGPLGFSGQGCGNKGMPPQMSMQGGKGPQGMPFGKGGPGMGGRMSDGPPFGMMDGGRGGGGGYSSGKGGSGPGRGQGRMQKGGSRQGDIGLN